jgi:hypothetical protein
VPEPTGHASRNARSPRTWPTLATRYDVERAVESSQLCHVCRHIVLVLCTKMDKGSTHIPPKHSPSLTRLALALGVDRRTIMRHLNHAETTGWIVRRRPPVDVARKHGITTAYRVCPQVGAMSPDVEAPTPYPVGTVSDAGRDSTPHRSDLTDLGQIVSEGLEKRTGIKISPEWGRTVAREILARPGIRSPAAYLKRVITTDPDPARWLPAPELTGAGYLCRRCGSDKHVADNCDN